MFRTIQIAMILLGLAVPAEAQTRFGVVWDPPIDRLEIEADLRAIRDMGFTAVRTGLVEDATILSLADSIGLHVYQEVPVALLTGPELADSLGWIRNRLIRSLALAEGHWSARHFGLAYAPASDRAETCNALATLAAFVRPRVAPGVRLYYVSWLASRDQCSTAVDLVLLDGALHDRPEALLASWNRPSPVGLAAVGTAVDPEAERGTLTPYSEERQAAFFSRVLDRLSRSRAEIVFLYRWQDPHPRAMAPFHPSPLGFQFGLQDETGRARPARDVAERRLTIGQTVFGLDRGSPPTTGQSWFLLGGWFVIITIVVMLAVSGRFRSMVPRYFMAHGFYRHAVHEGRDTPGLVTAGLLALLGVMIGLLASYAARNLMNEAAIHALWYRSGETARSAIDHLVDLPLLMTLLSGSVGLVAMVAWMSAWSFAASRTGRLLASQALMLAVWPRWTMLPLTLIAMIGTTLPPAAGRRIALALVAAWFITALWGTARTDIDLGRVARIHPIATVLLWLMSPAVLLAAGLVGLFFVMPDVVRYYVSLVTSAPW